MYRMAGARRFDLRHGAASAGVLQCAVEPAPASKLQIAAEIIGLDAALSAPVFQTLSNFCSEAAVADANRHQLCASATSAMVEHGDSLIVTTLGLVIGKRLGWPQERVDRLRAELEVVRDLLGTAGEPIGELTSCKSIERTRCLLAAIAEVGETGAARRRLAATGQSMEDLVADKLVERARRAGSSSASAAGG